MPLLYKKRCWVWCLYIVRVNRFSTLLDDCTDKFVAISSVQVGAWVCVAKRFLGYACLWWPEGAKLRTETVYSLLSWKRTCACWGFQSSSSTSSTGGPCFDYLALSTGTGLVSQVGSEIPDVEFRLYSKSRSCDVAAHNEEHPTAPLPTAIR